jgi:hypothetical protein
MQNDGRRSAFFPFRSRCLYKHMSDVCDRSDASPNCSPRFTRGMNYLCVFARSPEAVETEARNARKPISSSLINASESTDERCGNGDEADLFPLRSADLLHAVTH